MTFGEALDVALNMKGMDAKTLSEKSGMSQPYISKVKSGITKEPSWSKARKLIAALGMTPDEFGELQDSDL